MHRPRRGRSDNSKLRPHAEARDQERLRVEDSLERVSALAGDCGGDLADPSTPATLGPLGDLLHLGLGEVVGSDRAVDDRHRLVPREVAHAVDESAHLGSDRTLDILGGSSHQCGTRIVRRLRSTRRVRGNVTSGQGRRGLLRPSPVLRSAAMREHAGDPVRRTQCRLGGGQGVAVRGHRARVRRPAAPRRPRRLTEAGQGWPGRTLRRARVTWLIRSMPARRPVGPCHVRAVRRAVDDLDDQPACGMGTGCGIERRLRTCECRLEGGVMRPSRSLASTFACSAKRRPTSPDQPSLSRTDPRCRPRWRARRGR